MTSIRHETGLPTTDGPGTRACAHRHGGQSPLLTASCASRQGHGAPARDGTALSSARRPGHAVTSPSSARGPRFSGETRHALPSGAVLAHLANRRGPCGGQDGGRRRSPKRKGNPVQGACVCLWVLTSMTERPPCTRRCGRWLPCVMRVTASASNPNCPFGAVPTRGQATSPKPGAARRPPRGVLIWAGCHEPPARLVSPLQSPARRTRPRGGGQRRRSLTVRFSVKEGAHLARRVSLRPHHPERARSRLISETTQSLAWLAPGWEATQEDRVL